MNLLLTHADRHVVLLEHFRRAMRELGLRGQIVAADPADHAAAFAVADAKVTTPPPGDPAYISTLLEAVEAHGVKLLVPLGDAELRSLAEAREAFSAQGCRVLVSSPAAVAACQEAGPFRRAMTSAGLDVGRRRDLAGFRAEPFFPCFARCPHCSKLTPLSDDLAFQNYLQLRGDNPMLQDFGAGSEYAVDVYVRPEGDILAMGVRQHLLVRQDSLGDAVTVDDPELLELTRTVVAACPGLVGPICCRWVREANRLPKLIAVTPRLTFGAALSIEAGGDWPLYALAEAVGRDVEGPPTIEPNLMMVYHRANVFARDAATANATVAPPRFLH